VTAVGSSFTSYTVFLEPAVVFSARRYGAYAGPRIGWEQERLGSDITHVGGSFGVAGGALYTVTTDWAIGIRTQLDHLRLGAWRGEDAARVRGERWQIGIELRWTTS
jgi:hypothetical protein